MIQATAAMTPEIRNALEATQRRLLEIYTSGMSGSLEIHVANGKPRFVKFICNEEITSCISGESVV